MEKRMHERQATETVSNAPRVTLPLDEHPLLDLESDFSRIAIVAVAPGETPFVEVIGHGPGSPPVHVRGENGVTRVRLDLPWTTTREKWWEGSFWEAGFWEKRVFGKGAARVVLHVPSNVRAKIRSAAARIDVRDLSGCDLSLDADAGAITLVRVGGKLTLSTQAGRIDGRDIEGALSVSSSAAAVRLDVLSLDPGTHRISANMGSVRIGLAQGMPVRIDAKTQMGSSRIEYPSSREARAILEIEADLGSIRVSPSERKFRTRESASPPPSEGSPYRESAERETPHVPNAELEAILARVADGSLSPAAAKELLRGLGWS
jgi:hypothetical protein